MQVEVHARRIPLSDALFEYTNRRLQSSLDRLAHAVDSVVLRFSRLGGARRAADCRCLAIVRLATGEQVVVEEVDDDAYRAVDRVTDRARLALVRKQGRRMSLRRRPSWR